MKTIVPSIRKSLWPLKLYREDLEYVVNLLSDVSSEITIKTDDTEFENLSELLELKQKVLRKLDIESSNPIISLSKIIFRINEKI